MNENGVWMGFEWDLKAKDVYYLINFSPNWIYPKGNLKMTSLREWHKVKVAQGEKDAAKKVVSLTQNMFTSTFL